MSMVEQEPKRKCDIFHVGGDVREMRITVDEWSHELAAYRTVSESKPDMGKRARGRFWKLLNRALTPPARDAVADPTDRLCREAQHDTSSKEPADA